jgi:hypothetical protein
MKPKAKMGRPTLPEDKLRSEFVRVRCTTAEFNKFTQLGGADWLRQMLKRARPKGQTDGQR